MRGVTGERLGRRLVLGALGLSLVAVGGCSTPTSSATPGSTRDQSYVPPTYTSSPPATSAPAPVSSSAATSAAPKAGSALALLAQLRTADPFPLTGFTRAAFGPIDADVDGNGCDTRNDVLRRDFLWFTVAEKSNGCAVMSGSLKDPYTGDLVTYRRGPSTSGVVQVDAAVSLPEAWRAGAQSWSVERRTAFANDSLNLLAVEGEAAKKRAAESLGWQPPNASFRCAFAARQITVKHRYGLAVDARERATYEYVLRSCPDEPATAAEAFRLGGGPTVKTPQQIAAEKAKAIAEAKAAATAKAKAEARARAKAARVRARAQAAAQAKAAASARAKARAAAKAAAAKAREAAKAKAGSARTSGG